MLENAREMLVLRRLLLGAEEKPVPANVTLKRAPPLVPAEVDCQGIVGSGPGGKEGLVEVT